MTHSERIIAALKLQVPDAVPYIYNTMDEEIQKRILGVEKLPVPSVNGGNVWGPMGVFGEAADLNPLFAVTYECAQTLDLDAIGIQIVPPLYVKAVMSAGLLQIKDGLIAERGDFEKIVLPDPDDPALYKKLEKMLEHKKDRACYARVRLCCSPTLLSMGIENFSYALVDDPDLIGDVLHLYADWSRRVSQNLSELDFDFFWCFDDIAYETGLMFSDQVFEEYFLPNIKLAASGIKKPWIFHSDGNLTPVFDKLLEAGMNGVHPLEEGSMELDYIQKTYGGRICLVGNIDINNYLANGTPETVERAVKERISQLGPGGGYIISDSNSVPGYCKAENVAAMARAVAKYRHIY
jgi:uroporphyrinogen decarboxylase